MWIVRVALDRPYTFIVLALLILIVSPVVIARTPTDIFPAINIPVIAVAWQYTGLNTEELEGRITTSYERVLTTTVDNIQRIESTTVNGQAIIKVYLQPNARLDTANAQITAISQTVLRQYPPGTGPPLIINFSASSVPILQLALSGEGLAEQQLFDLGVNFLRPQLVTIRGVAIPFPFGGKQRQVMVDLNTRMLQAKGLAPADVLNTINLQNLVLPSGTAKIGGFEYYVNLNAAPRTVPELADLPIKVVGNSTIYLRDVANVRDGFGVQTNIVRRDGRRGTLLTVLKAGDASTLDVVDDIRAAMPAGGHHAAARAEGRPARRPVHLRARRDQRGDPRGDHRGVPHRPDDPALPGELAQHADHRGLHPAVDPDLGDRAELAGRDHQHHDPGRPRPRGGHPGRRRHRDHREHRALSSKRGSPLREAILEGAAQIAVPALVSTLCICIVFLPMFFLGGVARYLFVPLAEAVVFAMLASYVLSRTLVPTLAMYLLRPRAHHRGAHRATRSRSCSGDSSAGSSGCGPAYRGLLTRLISRQGAFVPVFLAVCLAAWLLLPWLGENFFPTSDNGQFILHLRAKTGTRIEETARLADLVEAAIRREIPAGELDNIIDNIGLPYSDHQLHVQPLRLHRRRRRRHPGVPEGGAPAHRRLRPHAPAAAARGVSRRHLLLRARRHRDPDPELRPARADRRADRGQRTSRAIARSPNKMLTELRQVPGLTDLRIQQNFDYPNFEVDRGPHQGRQARLHPAGCRQQRAAVAERQLPDHADVQFLNWQNGVSYNLVDPDAPVPHPVAPGSAEHADQRARP